MTDLLLRGARLLGVDAPVDVAVEGGVVAAIAPSRTSAARPPARC